jgi:synaptic vesicle membrane protein VAT-1
MGLYRSSWETVGWPLTPGFEIAGRIVGRGAVAGDLQIGERVVCITRFGGYAEMVAVPAHQAFRFTEQLSMALAASLPVSFITALHALDLAAASPGAAILVHSAAGAAGLAIVQAARHLNLRIFGVVGSIDKVETSLGAGADVVVMRTRGWDDEARRFCSEGFAAVFDAGGDTLRRSYALVAPLGRLIIYGSHGIVPTTGRLIDVPRVAFRYALMPRFGALALSNSNRSVMGFNLSYLFDRSDLMRTMMKRVMTMLEQRAIVPLPVERFRLSDAKAAHYRLHSGRTVGKLVLIPDSMW